MNEDEITTPSHVYELQKCSGTFMFIVDNCEPCFIKFNASIKLQVTLDDKENVSASCSGRNTSSVDFVVCDSISVSELKSSERHSCIESIEDSDNERLIENNELNFVKVKKEDVLHGDKNDKNSLATRYDLRRQKLGKRCNDNSFNVKGEVGVDNYAKDGSFTFPPSENIIVKDVNGSHEPKRARTGPQKSRARVCKNGFELKKGRKKPPKTIDQIDHKSELVADKNAQPHNMKEKSKDRRKKLKPQKLMMLQDIKCEYCDVTFPNKKEFYNHRRVKGSEFECQICHKIEAFEAHLIVHMLSHKQDQGFDVINDTDTDKSKQSDKKKIRSKKKKCNVCGFCTVDLREHMMLHTNESAYCCCICKDQFFPTLPKLHSHLEGHKESKGIRCLDCNVKFSTRSELSKHRSTHEMKCDICSEVFQNKTTRRFHYLKSHPNEIKRCSECFSFFLTDEELQKHIQYHRRRKSNQCPICGVVRRKLKAHMLLTHSATAGEKPFACDQCPMRYSKKEALNKHIRIHTGERPYACNLCPKRFRCGTMLRKHLMNHPSGRPFYCEVCYKTFTLQSKLVNHMKIHPETQHLFVQEQKYSDEKEITSFAKRKDQSPLHESQPSLSSVQKQEPSKTNGKEGPSVNRENMMVAITSVLSDRPIPTAVEYLPDAISFGTLNSYRKLFVGANDVSQQEVRMGVTKEEDC